MSELLIAAVVVLWVIVIALAIVVFALARQIGVLYERVAPAGALILNQQIKVGDPAPEISVQTLDGDTIKTGGANQLLFFLAPDCPICKSLLPILKDLRKSEPDKSIILLSDGDTLQEHRDYVAAHKLEAFPYALSEIAGRSYGVSKLPYAVLTDAAATVRSLGIVNSREHLESLFEAERLGIASVQEYLGTDTADADTQDLAYDASEQRS